MNLESTLRRRSKARTPSVPLLFQLSKPRDRATLGALIKKGAVRRVVDDYKEQEAELFAVKNPALVYMSGFEATRRVHQKKMQGKRPAWQAGTWAYFPWSSTLVHILPREDFILVRTARNRNLINPQEQKKFQEAVIGIAGLSVGSGVAFAIALQGGGQHIRLADMDRLALSNTNRILAGVENLGSLKVEMAARQIWEINPYTRIEIFSDGLTPRNIGRFFRGLDIVIDELDNLAVKYLIREQAKRHRIPVVMGADNGDNAVVDIERYDLDPRLAYCHGRLGPVSYKKLNALGKFGVGKAITRHIGAETVTLRMQASLLEVGKTIVSWPQLGGAALVNGAAVAYCVRKILNGEQIEKNRAVISLDERLIPNYNSKAERSKRARAAKAFKKIFEL